MAFYPGAPPSLRHEGNVRRLRAEPELLQVVTAAMTVLIVSNNSVRNMAVPHSANQLAACMPSLPMGAETGANPDDYIVINEANLDLARHE